MQKQEITREFLGRTDCAAYIIKLSENGYHEDVERLLTQCAKNTATYQIAKDKICCISNEEKTDHQGYYIGTYYTVSYKGKIIEQYFNYSLFN